MVVVEIRDRFPDLDTGQPSFRSLQSGLHQDVQRAARSRQPGRICVDRSRSGNGDRIDRSTTMAKGTGFFSRYETLAGFDGGPVRKIGSVTGTDQSSSLFAVALAIVIGRRFLTRTGICHETTRLRLPPDDGAQHPPGNTVMTVIEQFPSVVIATLVGVSHRRGHCLRCSTRRSTSTAFTGRPGADIGLSRELARGHRAVVPWLSSPP